MNKSELWRNFRLGEELHISGAFIYNGLRRFFELHKLILLEHSENGAQEELKESLKTHNHIELLRRVKAYRNV